MTLHSQLAWGLEALGIAAGCEMKQKLLAYVALLQKWNRVYNLTAVREPIKMLTHHVLDSIAIVPHLQGRTLLDVGSGAGLPGIPVACVLPQSQVVLLDSNQKKSSFQQQAVIELGLTNVEVVNARIELWETTRVFDTVVSRALADITEFVRAAARLCAADGMLAAMKGADPAQELAHLPDNLAVTRVVPLHVPGLSAERHLVLIRPAAARA